MTVRVITRSSKPGITGIRDGALLVRLQSPPVEGAANEELIEVIAKVFGTVKRDVRIISGEHSKLKRVAVASLTEEQLKAVLKAAGINPQELTS